MQSAPTSVARARELPEGTRLGRYTLQRRIARGGMAELYLAQSRGVEGFEKLVAIKLVLPHVADDPSFVEMFLDEARLAARLDHPNIVQVLDLGVAEGEHFMAMEYVHGRDVRQMLMAATDNGGLPLGCALTIVADACAGLHHAHELCDEHGRSLGVVHRDISPSNLIVRYDGGVKVVDFGIAKAQNRSSVTRTGALKGKAGYMSPEQCRGGAIDRRSDIFGLGILLFETTTCLRLFYGNNDFAVMNRIIDCEFDPPHTLVPDYPPELEAIVTRALSKDPAQRFPTAMEMRRAIEDFAQGHGVRLSTVDLATRMRELFGEVPVPTLAALPPAGPPGGSVVPTTPIIPTAMTGYTAWLRRRRSRATTVGLGVGGVALAVAGYLAGTASRGTEQPATESTTPAAAAAAPSVDEPADAERAEPTPAEVPAAPVEPPVEAAPPEPVAEPAPADPAVDPAADPTPPTPNKRRARRRRSKRASKASVGHGASPDDMMPRE